VSTQEHIRIVTPEQLEAGFCVFANGLMTRCGYRVIRKLEDGSYVVVSPLPEDGLT